MLSFSSIFTVNNVGISYTYPEFFLRIPDLNDVSYTASVLLIVYYCYYYSKALDPVDCESRTSFSLNIVFYLF